MKKLKILANFTDWSHTPERKKLNTFGGLGYYRMYKPAKTLTGHDVDIRGNDIDQYGTTFEKNWDNIFRQYDVYWAVHFLNEHVQSAQAYLAEKHNKILIYDLDDNYLDIHESNPAYERFQSGKRFKAILSASFSFADAITVSTEPLKERMTAHLKNVFNMEKPIYVIPNMNDANDWKWPSAPKHPKKVTIGYTGSNSHQDDLRIIMPVMNRLLSKYKFLHFDLMGAIDKKKVNEYFVGWDLKNLDRVRQLPVTATFWEYPHWLADQAWDIGLAPLVDTSFNMCKSHIKWMEYSMYKIPTVASRVYPYFMPIQGRDTIKDGETGFLCRNNEWEQTLEMLINNKSLRERVGAQAYEAVKRDWQYKDSEIEKTFNKMIKEVSVNKKKKKALK